MAKACATSGTVRWKAVSKHATWGRSGACSSTARIGARLCGWCSGASDARSVSSRSRSAVTRSGLACDAPPCTTRWPSAANGRPPSRSRSHGRRHGRTSAGVAGDARAMSGASSASPRAPVTRMPGWTPMPSTCPERTRASWSYTANFSEEEPALMTPSTGAARLIARPPRRAPRSRWPRRAARRNRRRSCMTPWPCLLRSLRGGRSARLGGPPARRRSSGPPAAARPSFLSTGTRRGRTCVRGSRRRPTPRAAAPGGISDHPFPCGASASPTGAHRAR